MHLKPVNRTAKRVISRGVHYEPNTKSHIFHSDAPTHKLKNIKTLMKNPNFVDYTGFKFGRFTVIGLIENDNYKKKSITRWLVRCSCGQYETRQTSVLRKMKTSPPNLLQRVDWCSRCDDLYRLQVNQKAKELGLSLGDYLRKKEVE